MSDDTKPQYDPAQFTKPDERALIDRERLKYLTNGGTIKKCLPVEMDRRGKRGAVPPPIECNYFRKGVGASQVWYPGYNPRPDRIKREG